MAAPTVSTDDRLQARIGIPPIAYDTLHAANTELMAALTLLWAASEAADCGPDDDDELTDAHSRTVALISMAQERLRVALRAIGPHV